MTLIRFLLIKVIFFEKGVFLQSFHPTIFLHQLSVRKDGTGIPETEKTLAPA